MTNTESAINTFYEEISNPEVLGFEIKLKDWIYSFVKVFQENGLVYLYYKDRYARRDVRDDYFDKLEFGGIWNGDEMYLLPYGLREFDLYDGLLGESAVRKRIAESVSNKMLEIIDDSPVTPTEKSAAIHSCCSIDDYKKHYLESEAQERYIESKLEAHYNSCIKPEDIPASIVVEYIFGEESSSNNVVQEYANSMVEKYAHFINHFLERESLCRKRINELIENPSEMLCYRKQIYNAIKDSPAKTVNLLVHKGGKDIECKIETHYLLAFRRMFDVSTCNLDSKSRKVIEDMKNIRLEDRNSIYANEIMEITYRGKALYLQGFVNLKRGEK